MGLQFSLLSSVAAIMEWVIRTEDGGLLNVLFRIVWLPLGHEPEFDLVTKVDAPVVDFFRKMLLLQPLPLPVLQVIPASLGGGQVAADNAHANPNRGADIFWITVFTFLLAVVLVILVQVVNYCCCCCKGGYAHDSMNALQMAMLRSNFANKQFVLRVVYIVLLVLALVFLTASIILFIVYFSSTGLVVSFLETNSQPSAGNQTPVSLPDGLHATVAHASSFVIKGITEGRVLTNTTLHAFVNRTYVALSTEVSDAIERLLTYLEVRNLLKKGEQIVEVMETFLGFVHDVYSIVTLLHNETASLEVKLADLCNSYTKALENVSACRHWDLCVALNATIANITSPIPSIKINITIIEPYLEELNKTIVTISSTLEEVRDSIAKLQNSTRDLLHSLKSELNLTRTLEQVESFWNSAQSHADKLLKRLNGTVDSVETQVSKYIHHIRVGFFIVGGVFMILLLVATLIAARLIYRAIHDRLFAHLNATFIDSRKSKWDDVVCGKRSVCCCSALFIPFLLLFSAIIALLLFVLTTISSEGCIYMERESAVRMSDFVVNGYVARRWTPLLSGAVGNLTDFLNTPPPKNILHALTHICDSEAKQRPVGLLFALGYRNLVDVSKLVSSSELTQAIQQGRKVIVEQIRDLNLSGLLPNGAEVEAVRSQLNDTISSFVLTELINYTNPTIMVISSFESILEDVKIFETNGNVSKADFSKPNQALKEAIQTMRKIKSGLEKTHQYLQNLDSRKSDILGPLGELVNALNVAHTVTEEARLTTEVGKEYDKLAAKLTDYMRVDGEATFAELTASLFPCEEAHLAYSAAIGVTCGEAGGVRLLIGVVYVFALNVLFVTFLYFALINLAFFQALQIHMISDLAEGGDYADFTSKHQRAISLK